MRRKLYLCVVIAEVSAAAAALSVVLPNLYHSAKYRVDRTPVLLVSYFAFAALAFALALSFALTRRGGAGELLSGLARAWSPLAVNLLIALRAALQMTPFFLEPLIVALSVGAVIIVSASAPRRERGNGEVPSKDDGSGRLPLFLLLAASLLAVVWLYFVQAKALSQLSLGYADGAIYYLRIKNTAIGRGLLQETLARPPFYDHFDIGLLVLVPVYWLLGSYKTVMWAQAAFLAAIGPAVYVYARGRGLGRWASSGLGLAALFYPSTSQMSLSFSYGFHPVTLAIPAVILSMHFFEKKRWAWFAAAMIFAVSMEETIIPFYAGMGLVESIAGKGRRRAGLALAVLSAALFYVVTRVIMPEFAGPERYFQMAKFEHLGGSVSAILLSPFKKPDVFWGLVFSRQSLIFVALLLGSVAFMPLLAPRQLLYPAIVLAFVLLLRNPDVKSISFQYQAMIVAAWLPAAAAGSTRLRGWIAARKGALAGSAVVVGVTITALCASHFYGMLPSSRMTVPFQMRRNEEFTSEARALHQFASGLSRHSRVLATMRAAALFVEALEVAPLQEWTGSTDYDVVVLQTDDRWGARQSPEEIRAVCDAMITTGDFDVRQMGRFILMTRRNGV